MEKPLTIGIYGESNTGKTRLTIDLVKHFIKENYKIATIKITDKKIGIDSEGKDTWKHSQAGANIVVFSSSSETDYIVKQKQSIKKILENICSLGDFDLILVEGANDEETPKIRIGDIKERKNTVLTYENDFEKLIKILKGMIK